MTPERPYPALSGAGARRLIASDDRVVVVGAGGWLGMATLEALSETLGEAFERRVVAFGSNERLLRLRGGHEVCQRPLSALATLPSAPSFVLHFAFLTQEKAKTMSEADYVAANRGISAQVLAALDPIGATGVFVASSGAVYLVDDPQAESSKRLYGRLKRMDEAEFSRWAEPERRRAVIARVFNVSGPYITKPTSYALGAFILDALAGGPIGIGATRPVIRSYVAINELMSVVFALLIDGGSGATIFDTAGLEALEMADIARAVADAIAPGAAVTRPPIGPYPPDRYVGNSALYQSLRHRFDVEAVDFLAQMGQTAIYVAEFGRGMS